MSKTTFLGERDTSSYYIALEEPVKTKTLSSAEFGTCYIPVCSNAASAVQALLEPKPALRVARSMKPYTVFRISNSEEEAKKFYIKPDKYNSAKYKCFFPIKLPGGTDEQLEEAWTTHKEAGRQWWSKSWGPHPESWRVRAIEGTMPCHRASRCRQ